MNCRHAQQIFADPSALDTTQRAALAEHVAGCAACQRMTANLSAAFTSLRAATAAVDVPSAEIEWQHVRRQIRAGSGVGAHATSKTNTSRRLTWFTAAPLAAAAALAVAFYANQGDPVPATSAVPVAEVARADNASTMVFVDADSGWQVVWTTAEPKSG